jgi:hypothetical protein
VCRARVWGAARRGVRAASFRSSYSLVFFHCRAIALSSYKNKNSAFFQGKKKHQKKVATMGLTFTKLFARLFSKKEMRILMVCF